MQNPVFALAAVLVLFGAAEPPPVGPVPPAKPAPEAAPVPAEKPEAKPAPSGKDDTAARQAPEDPVERAACLKALSESGAVFHPAEAVKGPGACGIEQPVELSEPAPGVRIEPPVLLRCKAALALADWTRETILPAAKRAFPERRVETLANASSYVCRNRNGADTGKVSEHAKGNAVDLSAVTLSGGLSLPMKPRAEDGDMAGAFQRAIAASACLYFTTVLSPGSDAAHGDHLHLDVLERRNGFRYCR